MDEKEIKFLLEIVDRSSSHLVGVLLKRLDLLDNQHLSVAQYRDIFKAELKEHIYENGRVFKALIKSYNSGVKFIAPKQIKKSV